MTATGGNQASLFRWLMVPFTVGLLALIGLAISSEDRLEFEARQSEPASGDSDNQFDPAAGAPVELDPADGQPLSPPDNGSNPGEGVRVEGPAVDGAPATIEITSDDGQVGILLGEGDPVAQPRGGDGGNKGQPIVLRPDADGDIAGLRLTGDGRLQPVGADDIRPGDLVLQPVDGGIDLVRGDGSRIEIRLGPDGASIEATEVGIDGQRRPLEVGEGGEIDAGDGVAISTPDKGPADPVAPQSLWEQATSTPWRWIFIGIAALAAISAAVAFALHRKGSDEPFGADFVGPAGVPRDRFGEFIAMLLADDDPARAIRLAFYAAERGLGGLPHRRNTETPFEWCARAVASHPQVTGPLTSLCSRYATARFAPEQPDPADRDAAVDELRAVFHLATEPADGATDGEAEPRDAAGRERSRPVGAGG